MMTRSCCWALAVILACGCAGDPTDEPIVPAPPMPQKGYPERGSAIDDAILAHYLPPPPRDAVPYQVRVELRNGRTVPVKKRWLWIPQGGAVRASRDAAGKLSLTLPVGARLWKEFYMTTGRGVELVERRILLKVATDDRENGWLLNGGWRFYSSYYLPARADGIDGFDTAVSAQVASDEWKRYIHAPDQWMPTRRKSAPTFLTFVKPGAAGADEELPYVFPGQSTCQYCHGGADATYGGERGRPPVLSFGANPENITPESVERIVKSGWLDASPELVAELRGRDRLAPPDDPAEARAHRVVEQLRNNCLSCHSPNRRAAAWDTAFALEPGRRYSEAELLSRLAVRSNQMGYLGKPMVTPGSPADSELVLRMKGVEGRRRMPPAEGGIPELDRELTGILTRWISATGS